MHAIPHENTLERVAVNGTHFILADSQQPFVPVGFNYDHDEHYRLLEDYWHDDWQKIVQDFSAMRALGANTVRIHLQAGKFLASPKTFHEKALLKLDDLLQLASRLQLRIHLVGLGCYHRQAVPHWYAHLPEPERWQTQTVFWQTLAKRYRNWSSLFCFDLMNEPLVPARKRHDKGWLGQDYHGSHFTQYISLDGTQAARIDIATRWVQMLTHAIREEDPQRLISIGLVDWSLAHHKPNSGFIPEHIAPLLDFVCTHVYPVSDAVDVPIIASGGVGTLDHLADGIQIGGADAVLAASIFHYGEFTVGQAKDCMARRGIPVRI